MVHLAFTLGHTATDGIELTDDDLADHAQYLAGVLHTLRPASPTFSALLSLILLTRARSGGRFDPMGAQVPLPEGNRSRWDRALIRAGTDLLAPALAQAPGDPMVLQAAIAADHCIAADFAAIDFPRVVMLYSRLLAVDPAPGFALGRCIAISYLSGPAAGLADLDEVLALGVLRKYPYAVAARAQMLEQLGRTTEAERDWLAAAEVSRTDAERLYFQRRAQSAIDTRFL